MRLEGRCALVTGAGSGIGRAIAVEAERRGIRLALTGRRVAALDATLALLQRPDDHLVVPGDVTSAGDRRHLVAVIAKTWGRLDILVNNAGLVCAGPLGEIADDTLERTFATNAVAPIALTRDLLGLLAAGESPRVVNIGSMFGNIPYPDFATYSASKAALAAFSCALRRELKPRGIAVTHVAPRATRTDAATVLDAAHGGASMTLDAPDTVARLTWDAVSCGRNTVYARGPERLYVQLQKLFPRLIDIAISRST